MTTEEPASPTPRRGILVRAGRAVAAFFAGLWRGVRPTTRVRRSVSWAILAIVLAYGAFLGTRFHSTFGWWPDLGIGAGLALLAVLLVPLSLSLLRWVTQGLRELFGPFGLAALLVLVALLAETAVGVERGLILAVAAAVPLALWVGGLAAMTAPGFGQRSLLARGCVVLLFVAGLVGNTAFVAWVVDDGTDAHAAVKPVSPAASPGRESGGLVAASPADGGPLSFEVLTYGSGQDRHRAEFGAEVALVTESVNGRPFVGMPKGWKGELREDYWGFDAGSLPRNGTAWCPEGDGPFPLVLCVHGNHGMFEASDPGYAYLGELFASRGFVFVSIDQNFLNSGGFVHGGMRKENDARAWMLLEHLSLWRTWNEEQGHRFAGRIDIDNVGLIGHSRGGEAVCLAAVFNGLRHYPDDASVRFDYGFGIRSVASIAPVDGQYRAADHDTAMRDVSYFTIHGGHDADVTRFHGDRLYRRVYFTEQGVACFKSSLWIYRANHGQFNTVWGAFDSPPPNAWLLNDAALMAGEDQRQIAKVFLSGFFETTLHGRAEYRALFRDVRLARGQVSDQAILISRYEDSSFRLLADFEEDVDVTTTSAVGGAISAEGFAIWREKDIPMRRDSTRRDHGVELAWDHELAQEAQDGLVYPVFELRLPEGMPVTSAELLTFAVAASDAEPEPEDYSDPPADGADDDHEEDADEGEGEEGGVGEEAGDAGRIAVPIEFSIELTDDQGLTSRRSLRDFGDLMPPLDVVVRRDGFRSSEWSETFEPVLQTFRCPLAAFASDGFDVARLRTIRLVFDGTGEGAVYLDRIGFGR